MNVDLVGIMLVGRIIPSGFDIVPSRTNPVRVYSHLPSVIIMNYMYVSSFDKVKIVYLYDN